MIRFSLDPLAEYLAALYLVEWCGKIEDMWKEFFENAEKQSGAPEAIRGFLLAVRDCCDVKGNGFGVPEEVNDALARLTGFDSAAISSARLKQRINLLLMNLNSFTPEDRRNAAEALARIGPKAKEAVPALIAALNDQDAEVRRSAAEALARIGPEAKEAVPALIAALKDQDILVRSHAAEALARIGKEAVPALIGALKDQDADARRTAASVLGGIGPEAEERAPALIAALKDQNEVFAAPQQLP